MSVYYFFILLHVNTRLIYHILCSFLWFFFCIFDWFPEPDMAWFYFLFFFSHPLPSSLTIFNRIIDHVYKGSVVTSVCIGKTKILLLRPPRWKYLSVLSPILNSFYFFLPLFRVSLIDRVCWCFYFLYFSPWRVVLDKLIFKPAIEF